MQDTTTIRVLDASLNRAAEGLRVVEDFTRFVLDDPFFTGELKNLRHDLATASTVIESPQRHAVRDTRCDVGAPITTQAEQQRIDAWAVCAANIKRTEQSLRSLEEYGKLLSSEFAAVMESLRYRLYTLEKAIDIGRTSRQRLRDLRLCVLIEGRDSTEEFETFVRALVTTGPVMIQLRDKQLDDRRLMERARTLVSLTRRGLSPFTPHHRGLSPFAESVEQKGTVPVSPLAIINDRPDIAAAAVADGVHLGQEDFTVKDARAIVGPRMLIGVSTHSIDQARAAVLDGASYIGAGPTFPSNTKNFDAFAGLDYLSEVAAQIRLPTFAIGGITAKNLPEVLATGISRVAVSAAVTSAANPASAAHELLDMLKEPASQATRRTSQPVAPSP
jgi:thiamine-phosphate pyrophosphorylase